MDYWQPANGSGARAECRNMSSSATRGCVANSTTKITGDDAGAFFAELYFPATAAERRDAAPLARSQNA